MGQTTPTVAFRQSRAFTLIELLVVVAIIAILMSILLPAMNSARAQSRAVLCATHLNHVGKAVQIYLAENNAVFPPSYIYPLSADGIYDFYEQPLDHPYGYLHWTWYLYGNGAVEESAFTCPEIPRGGLPRTNPGEIRSDWESGQVDQRGQTDPNTLVDKQVPRIAYTANAAIIPRNKFTTNMIPGALRTNQFVSETDIQEPRGVILATEFNKNWKVASVNEGGGLLCKSHRPVSPFYSLNTGANEYISPEPAWFVYGDPYTDTGNRYGIYREEDINEAFGVIDGSRGPEVNAVGRHHPGGDEYGGSTNFLFTDGHVERTTVLKTMEARLWGGRYYSISGDDTEILQEDEY